MGRGCRAEAGLSRSILTHGYHPALMTEAASRAGAPARGEDRRPRALGLALTVVALAVLWIGIVPQVNNVLRYNDPVKPGERMAVAAGISFAPPTGWNVEAGLRTTDKTRTGAAGAPVTLVSDAITMKVMPVPFRGGPRELLNSVIHSSAPADGSAITIQGTRLTSTGETLSLPVTGTARPGIAEHFVGLQDEALVGAFVFGDTGVTLSVTGPSGQLNDQGDEIGEMLTTFRYRMARPSPDKPKPSGAGDQGR